MFVVTTLRKTVESGSDLPRVTLKMRKVEVTAEVGDCLANYLKVSTSASVTVHLKRRAACYWPTRPFREIMLDAQPSETIHLFGNCPPLLRKPSTQNSVTVHLFFGNCPSKSS